MFSELNKLEFGNEVKSRRSVVAFSLLLILFSNLILKNDEMILLGLKVEISQYSVVAVLKLFLLLSLIAYVFAFLEILPKRIARILRKRDEAWWIPVSKQIDEFHEQSNPNYEYEQQQREFYDDSRDWDDDMYEERRKRKKRRQRVAGYYRPITSFTRTVTNVFWPLGLAYISFSCPEIVFVFR